MRTVPARSHDTRGTKAAPDATGARPGSVVTRGSTTTASLRNGRRPQGGPSPPGSAAGRILAMQQSVGNRAVQRSVGDLVGALTDTRRGLVGAVLSLPAWLGDAAASGPMPATVRMLVRRGNEDEDSLTNTCFFLSHPGVPWGTRLRPDEAPEHRPLVADWLRIRDEVVRPELGRIRTARSGPAAASGTTPAPAAPRTVEAPSPSPTPAPLPTPPAPAAPSRAVTADSRSFLDQHRDLLRQLPTTGDDELLFLLDHVLAKGSATVIEYHAYNYTRPHPVPLTHQLFQRRNPGVDPLTSLVNAKGQRYAAMISGWERVAESMGGWDRIGVTLAHWAEITSIRDDVVYPLMRIVLPRIEAAAALPDSATVGEQIAHRAHVYLGVRYASGQDLLKVRGRLQSDSPEAADPSREQGAMDCSTLVHQTIVDMGLRSPGRRTEDMLASPLMEPVEEPELGDLLLRPGHVGIYIGGGQVIEAPHTGRVVSKTTYKGLGDGTQGTWTAIRRYDPQPAQ